MKLLHIFVSCFFFLFQQSLVVLLSTVDNLSFQALDRYSNSSRSVSQWD